MLRYGNFSSLCCDRWQIFQGSNRNSCLLADQSRHTQSAYWQQTSLDYFFLRYPSWNVVIAFSYHFMYRYGALCEPHLFWIAQSTLCLHETFSSLGSTDIFKKAKLQHRPLWSLGLVYCNWYNPVILDTSRYQEIEDIAQINNIDLAMNALKHYTLFCP
jgi:hypothetical protein